jgi:hypothetical protein
MPPFFILGNPRSGTTLLQLMLTCNSELIVPPECGFAVWFLNKYKDKKLDNECLLELSKDIFFSKKFETWDVSQRDLYDGFVSQGIDNYTAAVDFVYRLYAKKVGKEICRWGDKNNFYLNHVLELDNMFSTCSFIHIVRDGRDVACSYKWLASKDINSNYAPKLPKTISGIAEDWSNNVNRIKDSLALIDRSRVISLRFEDLLEYPDMVLDEICSVLDINFDDNMLYYYNNNIDKLIPSAFSVWKKKSFLPPDKGEIGRYKHELSCHELALFEKIAGKVLCDFGYDI